MTELQKWIRIHPRGVRVRVRTEMGLACGVSEGAVRHYANGSRPIPAIRLRAMAEFTGLPVADLLPASQPQADG